MNYVVMEVLPVVVMKFWASMGGKNPYLLNLASQSMVTWGGLYFRSLVYANPEDVSSETKTKYQNPWLTRIGPHPKTNIHVEEQVEPVPTIGEQLVSINLWWLYLGERCLCEKSHGERNEYIEKNVNCRDIVLLMN